MSANKKEPSISASINGVRRPVSVEDTESFFKKRPAWRFATCDLNHEKWSVLDSVEDDIVEDSESPTGTKVTYSFSKSLDIRLLEGLRDRENMPWSEIITQSGGRGKNGGTNSHYLYIHELCKDAQKRAEHLNIEADQLFSLRLESKKRVWGILEDGVLDIIWFDRKHEVYPTSK